MAGEQVPWPQPPREPGPWGGGPPVAPPGNTPLPPLPGASGTMHGTPNAVNPWSATGPAQPIPVPGGPAPFPGLPPGGRPRVDRAPTPLLVLAGLVVLAVVAGAVYLVRSSGDDYPSAWDPKVEAIADWVARDRKLSFDHPVEVRFLSPAEYTKASGGGEDPVAGDTEDDDESKQAQEDELGQLRALGLLAGAPDLEAATKALSDSGTLAFYSPDTKEVYVRGTKMTPGLRVTLAHELTHVLQDQHFDLERMGDMDSSDATVFRALAEGDATRIEEDYVADVLTDAERTAYEQDSAKQAEASTDVLDGKVPPILTTFFSSPYILGPRLVSYLDQLGSDKIDDALDDTPSEEVLFDPLVFDRPKAVATKATVDPPEGKEADDRDQFGPTALYLVLAARLEPKVALAAVDGWGGDEYVTYDGGGGKVCLRAAFRTDTPADAEQLTAALTDWSARSPATAKVEGDADQIVLQTCDPGAEAEAVGNDAASDLLVLPATRTDAYLARRQAGADDRQARCFADGLIDRATIADLSSEEWFNGPGQQLIAQLAGSCT